MTLWSRVLYVELILRDNLVYFFKSQNYWVSLDLAAWPSLNNNSAHSGSCDRVFLDWVRNCDIPCGVKSSVCLCKPPPRCPAMLVELLPFTECSGTLKNRCPLCPLIPLVLHEVRSLVGKMPNEPCFHLWFIHVQAYLMA